MTIPRLTVLVVGATSCIGYLGSGRALRKTFELIASTGPAQDDFDTRFASLTAEPHGDAALAHRPAAAGTFE